MADGLRKAAVWLGLVASDDYATPADAPVEEELTGEVPAPAAPASADTPAAGTVTELDSRRPAFASPEPPASPSVQIVTVRPRTYNEARTIGENFRDGIPVIMNITDMDHADARRLIDFAAGLTFGAHGSIDRVASKVFLLTPCDVVVTAEDKERIAGGFYNQS